MKRHAVQVLRAAGQSFAAIAAQTGVPERTARRIVGEPPVVSLEMADQNKPESGNLAPVGRPSKTAPFRKLVSEVLDSEPSLPTRELLRRARSKGYSGGKSAFYAMVKELRPQKSKLVTRFEGLPGEFSQHDFGELDVTYVDGSKERVHFFASRLKYSRLSRVSVVPNQQSETLVRATCEHFEYFGGIPLLAVFDRPKTIVSKSAKNGVVKKWNPVFAHAMFEMGVAVELCWPYSPQQKGSVENLVKFVKNSFFKHRFFQDRDDVLAQLEEWHREVNDERPSRATGEIPRARMKVESERLRPLKVQPDALAVRVAVRVGPTAMINFEGNQYSISPNAIGFSGTAYVYQDAVTFVAGKYEARHPRLMGSGHKSTLPHHRAERIAAVSGQRAETYQKREDLLNLGEIAMVFVTELVSAGGTKWCREIDQLHELLCEYGDGLLKLALHMAHAERDYSARAVENALTAPGLGRPQ